MFQGDLGEWRSRTWWLRYTTCRYMCGWSGMQDMGYCSNVGVYLVAISETAVLDI
jgi:hypothetical protein